MAHEYFADVRAAADADGGFDGRGCEAGGEHAMFNEAPDLNHCGGGGDGGRNGGGQRRLREAQGQRLAEGRAEGVPEEAAAQELMALTMDVDSGEGSEGMEGPKRPDRVEEDADGPCGGGGSFALGRLAKRPRQHGAAEGQAADAAAALAAGTGVGAGAAGVAAGLDAQPSFLPGPRG
ncbi:hypothetical protein MNEG_15888 [Monoraphidium neglectum]|uniref:Uncharacterized protein n=1 Tax=Monoraphidium neglectum TaxID=145388 RepID=A0A0D2M9L3_9CHLO|nr:hypothetical protein MNEG_15888 [Monoraphidium neglectum]KIY92075.1 hypothetical protein MNEG_15888 [Monoraphidium neglectum]|eukprot:XP_013891095.1 hypothetical protein MNEG_15888 [Monoraphidium neglectum]